jgi:NAD(P)-dependent dehydrogenase (short-subunit alcohol dehydrogenase family)
LIHCNIKQNSGPGVSTLKKKMSKTIVIIGGSSGISAALADRLLAEGHRVLTRCRREGPGEWAPFDAADEASELALPDHIDGLVYAPGSINLKPFKGLRPNDWQSDWNINVMGAVRVLQRAEKALLASGSGSVVLFSTVAVGTGMPYHASVAASKGALEGLCRSLAAEWAPKIRVNAIAPSITDTPMAQRLLSSPEKKDNSKQRHPLQRIGSEEELAGLSSFLLSEAAAGLTGQILRPDNGLGSLRLL